MKSLAKRLAIRAIKLIHPRFGLSASDVILAAYPKSGSTWFRFILANIISLSELDGVEVDYHLINGPLASSYDSHRYPKMDYQTLPRFVATHRQYSHRSFRKHRAVYMQRHPGDTMVSFYEYRRARKDKFRYPGDFKTFIRHPQFGIEAWCAHVRSWHDHADGIVSYESLRATPAPAVMALFGRLGVDLPNVSIVDEAVRRSDFTAIRQMEERRGLDARARMHLREGTRFARKGLVGEWANYGDSDDEAYLVATLTRYGLAPPPPYPAAAASGPDR